VFTNTKLRFVRNCFLAVILVPLGIYFGHNGIERALLIGSVLLVLVVEYSTAPLKLWWIVSVGAA